MRCQRIADVVVETERPRDRRDEIGAGPRVAARKERDVVAAAHLFFDEMGDFGILTGKAKIARWRQSLRERVSVREAVGVDYPELLRAFMRKHDAYLLKLEGQAAA